MNKAIPQDKVNLRLIFVAGGDQSGKEFLVSPTLTATEIALFVYENWPADWSASKVDRAEVLRFIYQGRFLHENVTLESININPGRTCVMHLVPREKIPEPNIDTNNKEKIQQNDTGCCVCSIL